MGLERNGLQQSLEAIATLSGLLDHYLEIASLGYPNRALGTT